MKGNRISNARTVPVIAEFCARSTTVWPAASNSERASWSNSVAAPGSKRMLANGTPNAATVLPSGAAGHCGYASGVKTPNPDLPTDPAQRALVACERAGNGACNLYAVDDAVVWKP